MSLVERIQTLSNRVASEFGNVRSEITQSGVPFGTMILRNTDTTTDVYTQTARQIPIGGITSNYGTGFSRLGNAIVTNFSGFVRVTGSLHLQQASDGSGIRQSLAIEYYRNLSSLNVRFNTNYVRDSGNNNAASTTGDGFISPCNVGDQFSLFGISEGSVAGPLFMSPGRSYLMVERVG